jgi:hypothetical protein
MSRLAKRDSRLWIRDTVDTAGLGVLDFTLLQFFVCGFLKQH